MAQVPGSGPVGGALDRAIDAVLADPLLAAAVVLVATALVLLGLLLIRRLFVTKGVALKRALGKLDQVVVLMHPNPDPDAMAAAIGVARLAELADTEPVIQFPGQIRHQENRAFRTVLDLDLEPIESAMELGAEQVVLVDHNEPRGFDGADRISPYAVIDHHPGEGTGSTFTDVRSEYGASASMVAEYFREIGARPTRDEPEVGPLTTPVATGLLYGILADTAHLTRGCTRAEFDAAAFLYPAVDEDSLDRIANPQVDQEILDVISRAIADRQVNPPYAVADVGDLSNLDAIPQAADQLLTLEGVTAVVVLGEKDGTLHLSGRSRDDRVHMGNVLQTVAESIPSGEAGGHARMGGGQFPIEEMREGVGPEGGLTREELHERLFDALVGDV
ncbi:MAG: DHHA1 domain-containing protein [Halobacteriales archaeon]|nr:DHHA1 domain-containing protein [Halobacteriales archaeon]